MKAVILAAGRGGRLGGVLGRRPKCLARVGPCTLLEHQCRTLRQAGTTSIAVVAGFRAGDVRRACGSGIEVVHNPRFDATNSLYSLWLARDLLTQGFVVLNSDVLAHPQIVRDLLTARYEDALLMSARRNDQVYSDEEMKIHTRRGVVLAIDKAMPDADADGENIGIAKFGPAGAALLVEEMTRLVSAGALREWLPRAFDLFCRRRPLYVVESRGYPWIEIDFPEDYWRACSEVQPAIEADENPAKARARRAPTVRRRVLHHV
jgi:choline kinase